MQSWRPVSIGIGNGQERINADFINSMETRAVVLKTLTS